MTYKKLQFLQVDALWDRLDAHVVYVLLADDVIETTVRHLTSGNDKYTNIQITVLHVPQELTDIER